MPTDRMSSCTSITPSASPGRWRMCWRGMPRGEKVVNAKARTGPKKAARSDRGPRGLCGLRVLFARYLAGEVGEHVRLDRRVALRNAVDSHRHTDRETVEELHEPGARGDVDRAHGHDAVGTIHLIHQGRGAAGRADVDRPCRGAACKAHGKGVAGESRRHRS